MTAGYSGKPLVQKLGIQPGMRLIILNAPEHYATTLGALPEGVEVAGDLGGLFDFIHFFTASRVTLDSRFPELKTALKPNGMLWVSWPKKASKLPTDLDENLIRDIGLRNGLVDVKVAAIDERWSGLKFVYRVKDRGQRS
jgi:hypothetical protein